MKTYNLADKLEDWAKRWYDYSFNTDNCKDSKEMQELKEIIEEIRTR